MKHSTDGFFPGMLAGILIGAVGLLICWLIGC